MTTEKKTKIEVTSPGVKEKFKSWIEERGGVIVWYNVNLSNPNAGCMFTPLVTKDGKDGLKLPPHWSVAEPEVVKELSAFRFVKELKEVKRVKNLKTRMGGQGFTLKLTQGSSNLVKRALDAIQKQYGVAPCYHFEYDEAVIEVPVWED